MAPSILAFLGLPLVAAASLGDSVTLLQQSSGPEQEQSLVESLPAAIFGESDHPASAALIGTETVAEGMAQAVKLLQARLGEMHHDMNRNLEVQDTMYKKKLQAQQLENEVVRNTNVMISESIAAVTKHNAEKRAKCKEVMEANEVLRANLTLLKEDIHLASDFVTHSKEEVIASNADAPQLQVLAQLDEADHHSASRPKLSMLDRGESRPHHEDPAERILKGLSESLEKLSEEEKDGAAKLKAHFMELYKSQALVQSNLRSEQAKLNATQASLNHLGVRLDKALTHLDDVHKSLSDRLASALSFTQAIHTRHNKEAKAQPEPAQVTPTQMTSDQHVQLESLIAKALKEAQAA